ncbi:NDR1/HIN1-Like protein 3 [Gossypium australe]|uniref:NDR1/HIN1-Like protein 3 n=1 Tax=Gossypium australe TaxID=47621 RepID=A0A5B6WIT6_9ROSI|nr:NDR1/HIN1-Like protein 3 [Gossypium australe]
MIVQLLGVRRTWNIERYLSLPTMVVRSKRATFQGIHYCKWSRLCIPKEEGGLGFRDLAKFNIALLTKQVDETRRILYIPISHVGVSYFLVWRPDNSGEYSVKSGYKLPIRGPPKYKVRERKNIDQHVVLECPLAA